MPVTLPRLLAGTLLLGIHIAALAQSDDVLPGLVATYRDANASVRLTVPAAQFFLEPQESVHPSIRPDFTAEWTGLLLVLAAGNYRFDSGAAEVAVDGRAVSAAPMTLAAGRHPLRIRYRRPPGPAQLLLWWQGERFAREPIPSSAFSHRQAETISREDALAEQGRWLAEELGCVNCHRSASSSLEGRLAADLTAAGSRLDPRWLYRWLENPQSFRPGAVMPAISDESQRRDVAAYLSSLRAPPAAPARARKGASGGVANGTELYGLLGCAACHQQESLALDGMASKTTLGPLSEYLKDPVRFDPGGRMPSFFLRDEEASALAAYLLESRNTAFEQPWTAGDPQRGKALVESLGCLACHALRDAGPLQNRQVSPLLEKLSGDGECRGTHYRLSPPQREALRAFLTRYRRQPDVSPAPVHQLYGRLEQLRCAACHALDHLRPPVALAEAAPPLTDAGAKLRTGWIEQVMTKRQRSRRWLELRMPEYGPGHSKTLAVAFAKAAGMEPGDGPAAPAATEAHRTRGAGMIGADPRRSGLACIGCHDWGSYKSLGEEAPQLIDITRRLRWDWYYRWMLDPARILSGTSMPNYFGSLDPKRAGESILSLWAALSLGDKMPVPEGLETGKGTTDAEALPVPEKEPIVVRWDMPEATPAAIAVGLPGGVSYCFDAGESRLRYAWRGGFLDLTATLTRKTDANRLTPTAKLIGEVFYRSEAFPWRVGGPDRVPQARFRGYQLVGGYPQFHYQVAGVDVYERIVPTSDKKSLTRDFRLPRVDQEVWFIDGQLRKRLPQGQDVTFQVTP
jgi:mono/diheme cytochrome c family protein